MKTPRYTTLILLISIALIGSIVVQGFWVYRGYVQSEQHLQESLDKVLQETVDALTDRERIAVIANLSDSSPKHPIKHTVKRIIKSDTTIDVEAFVLDTILHKEALQTGNKESQHIRVEYKTEFGSTEQQAQLASIADSLVDQVVAMERAGELDQLLQKINVEEWIEKGSWQDRISMKSIELELNKQLANAGVELPHEYAVINAEGAPFRAYSTSEFKPNTQSVSAKTRMFPSDLKDKDVYLTINADDVFGFLIAQIWVLLCVSSLFTLLMVALFVITVRKLMSQTKLSQLKTDFINNMSHELKTPLATISLATDSLQHPEIARDQNKIDALAGTIRTEQNRILGHVDRILHLAQANRGTFELQKEKGSIQTLIKELLAQLAPRVEEHNVAVRVDIPEEVSVEMDPLHFKSAVYNVLDNALKYGSIHPKLSISAYATGKHLKLTIADNGIGMSMEEVTHALDRFYRAQSGNTHDVKGFGLGLSYVKAVVEAHGGTIKLESELTKGTTVTIQIPIHG